MNYGEEWAYWYLRLNGFFPISNFVIHSSSQIKYSSDWDVLAVRLPHVYEEIGGGQDDWDCQLRKLLDFRLTLGVICQVKTGKIEQIFREEYVNYAVDRLGFAENLSTISSTVKDCLREHACCSCGEQYQISKLLIANRQPRDNDKFLFISLEHTREFIKQRIKKYPEHKHGTACTSTQS